MKKIIHMSDLHIGVEGLGARFRQIIDDLKVKRGKKASDDVIVITGDLVDNAHHQENFDEVREGLSDLKKAGFNDILVIPGNHDYGTGSRGNKKFVEIFKKIFYKDKRSYPRKDIIGDIAFIGLDSMAEELHWYDKFWSQGELGKQQLSRLKAILNDEDVRNCKKRVIYLHHHPFDARPLHQLKDSKKLKKVLMQAMDNDISIDALLYGHNHEGKAHNGHWGIARCYDAGSATLKPRPKAVKGIPWYQVYCAVRVIDIQDENVDCDLELSFS